MSRRTNETAGNVRPRSKLVVGSAAALAVSVAFGAGCSANKASSGGDVGPIPHVVHDPNTGGTLTLDCTDYFNEGSSVLLEGKGGPRRIVFVSGKDNWWAAPIVVKYGRTVLDANGNPGAPGTKVKPGSYWVAQYNTGNPKTTQYASGSGDLPHNWDSLLSDRYIYTPNGTPLPRYGISPIGDGAQVVVARMSPYAENQDVFLDGQQVLVDDSTVSVDCEDSINNVPLPPDRQRFALTGDLPGQNEIEVIHVPSSIAHGTQQNMNAG